MSGTADGLKPWIARLARGEPLAADDAANAFGTIMSGEATPSQMGAFLMALAVRGETVAELTGGARAMRAKMLRMSAPEGAMDIVGTGGDGKGTLNISTATAIVVAGCGVTVAKHGNRAATSRSGAADVLSASGVDLAAEPPVVQRTIDEIGLGFMLAPLYHRAMRHVMPTRQDLGVRTIFNLLGPLANPACVRRYLLGVPAPQWVEPVARVLVELGADRAWVVHSGDGCDELTLAGGNHVAVVEGGAVRHRTVAAADASLPPRAFGEIAGGSPQDNAAALGALLEGRPGAFRDTVLFNAAAALVVAERAASLEEGAALASSSIDSGAAKERLSRLAALTGGRS